MSIPSKMSDLIGCRLLPDGRVAEIVPLTYGRARLCVRPADCLYFFDDLW